ncbi:MAG: hypothetical protein P8P74_04160 [Crocinitomicaceae bacterium]|nr:hypothetical protein [Crocinitomicaceae bacterium]
MTSTKTRALAIFVITAFVLAVLFFTLPINIFDGEIHVVEPQRDYVIEAPLSLSNFIGIGYDEVDMQYVESFNLTGKGWAMAAIFIFGFPALLAYRIYLKSVKD